MKQNPYRTNPSRTQQQQVLLLPPHTSDSSSQSQHGSRPLSFHDGNNLSPSTHQPPVQQQQQRQFSCLYTKHKTQKHKIWRDGRFVIGNGNAKLFSVEPRFVAGSSSDLLPILVECEWNTISPQIDQQLEIEQFLIQIEGPWMPTSTVHFGSTSSPVPASTTTTTTTTKKKMSMQKLFHQKFQKPKRYLPPPPHEKQTKLQAVLGNRKRPLQPGEWEKMYHDNHHQHNQHYHPPPPPLPQSRNGHGGFFGRNEDRQSYPPPPSTANNQEAMMTTTTFVSAAQSFHNTAGRGSVFHRPSPAPSTVALQPVSPPTNGQDVEPPSSKHSVIWKDSMEQNPFVHHPTDDHQQQHPPPPHGVVRQQPQPPENESNRQYFSPVPSSLYHPPKEGGDTGRSHVSYPRSITPAPPLGPQRQSRNGNRLSLVANEFQQKGYYGLEEEEEEEEEEFPVDAHPSHMGWSSMETNLYPPVEKMTTTTVDEAPPLESWTLPSSKEYEDDNDGGRGRGNVTTSYRSPMALDGENPSNEGTLHRQDNPIPLYSNDRERESEKEERLPTTTTTYGEEEEDEDTTISPVVLQATSQPPTTTTTTTRTTNELLALFGAVPPPVIDPAETIDHSTVGGEGVGSTLVSGSKEEQGDDEDHHHHRESSCSILFHLPSPTSSASSSDAEDE